MNKPRKGLLGVVQRFLGRGADTPPAPVAAAPEPPEAPRAAKREAGDGRAGRSHQRGGAPGRGEREDGRRRDRNEGRGGRTQGNKPQGNKPQSDKSRGNRRGPDDIGDDSSRGRRNPEPALVPHSPDSLTPPGGEPPTIIARDNHDLSRREISQSALKVLYRLHKGGFRACLVGGGVRDVLLGKHPKDFDIATDAHPEDVRDLFRNCRLIGRRFRLAHVRFGPEIIEVATFRAAHDPEDDRVETDEGRILRDNVYGTIHEDVWRRDFTVNALYYDIGDFSIIDYVGGMADLEARLMRLIGDPETRYREDPVRMLRAVRLAEKLEFTIEEKTAEPIPRLAPLLGDIAPARLFDESLKLFQGGAAVRTFHGLRREKLFGELFPATEALLADEGGERDIELIVTALANTDRRVAEDLPITPAFLYAALLWAPFKARLELLLDDGVKPRDAWEIAGDAVISELVGRVALPRRFSLNTKEIWSLQYHLEQRSPRRALRMLEQKRFRAGYDFFVMRANVGEVDVAIADWWTEIQEAEPEAQVQMVSELADVPAHASDGGSAADGEGSAGPKKRRRRRRPRRRKPGGGSGGGNA